MAPQPPYSTVGGYGGNPSLELQPSGAAAAFSDSVDGFAVVEPVLNPVTGQLTAAAVDATAISEGTAFPEINAILIELRVISNLLIAQLGATQLDLEQMRADENYNTNPNTGVV